MRVVARFAAIAALAAALTSCVMAAAGCGSSGSGATSKASAAGQWKMVTTSRVSGDQPVKTYLGSHDLGNHLRLAWVLSGPKKPPVTLTLRIINVKTGTGYGHTVTQSGPGAIAREDEQAMSLLLIPGEYRIFFSQRFPPAKGPGYDIKLTLYSR